MEITKEDFLDYEGIRQSGVTNMFDVKTVVALSDDLTKEKCFDIMKNYSKYKNRFTKAETMEQSS